MSSVLFSRARRTGIALAIAGAFLLGGSATAAPIGLPGDALGEPAADAASAMLPQDVAPAVLPGYVAGTRWLVVNTWQAVPLSPAAAVMRTAPGAGTVLFTYSSAGGTVMAPLDLPLGAAVWQIDVYGYRTAAGTQDWYMIDKDATTGNTVSTAGTPLALSGTGLIHGAVPFGGAPLGAGHTWSVALAGTGPTSGFVGVIVQYTQPVTNVLVPITPVRVFDSRFSSRVVQGAPRTINVKDAINVVTGAVTTANAIPKGARAISFTVTVTGTGDAGYVSVLPGTTTTVTASTINWTGPGATLATGGIVSLGTGAAERQVTLVVGGAGSASTDVIIDITGYYISET